MEPLLKLLAIKTNDGLYISDNTEKQPKYNFTSQLNRYRFDGNIPEPTYHKDWFLVKDGFKEVKRYYPSEQINHRYELKDGYIPNDELPKIINKRWIDDEDQEYNIIGLYDKKYEETEERYENVEYKIEIIATIDDFKPIKPEYNLNYSILDRIVFNPILLPTRPCKLSTDETYKIIRNYIKQNINLEWAKITSDYDFCFTVKKLVYLDQPEEYQIDVANLGWGKRKRKPRYETRYRKTREVTILHIAPKPYQNYRVVEPFVASSYEELLDVIENTLSKLIEEINEPLVDCPHCNGLGVILKGNKT